MKKILQKSERGVAFLLAFLMAVFAPASVLAANPIITEIKDEGKDLDYTFTETASEDGTTADIQLEIIEKNGSVLTEVVMPDGSVIYPDARDGQDGFKQTIDGVEKKIVRYKAFENGSVNFKLKYNTSMELPAEEETDSSLEGTENSEIIGFTDVPADENQVIADSSECLVESTESGSEEETEAETDSGEIITEPQSEQNIEVSESLIEEGQNVLSKLADSLFPVMEVRAAGLNEFEERVMEVSYEVLSILPKKETENQTGLFTDARAGNVVTTFDELKAAVANAGDGDTIKIEGTIMVPETIKIGKNITLEGGTLIKEEDIALIEISIGANLELSNIILDGNRNNIVDFKYQLVPLVTVNRDTQLLTTGTTILQNNYSSNPGAGFVGSAIGHRNKIRNCKVTITEGTIIQNNEIGSGGGAIGIDGISGCEFYMTGGEIKNNKADTCGGGLYVVGCKVHLLGGSITDNVAGYGGGALCDNPFVGGDINITGNSSLNDRVPDDLYLEVSWGDRIYLESEFTGQIGVRVDESIAVPDFQDIVVEAGFNPLASMTENEAGNLANFFSDNPDYITRLEPDGDNNKIVLGFPKVTYHTKGGDFAPGEEQEFYTATNQPITKPSNPTYTDHAFIAWYTTADYQDGTEFDFNTPITKDTDLYARWFPDVYFIDFDANGGTGTMDTIVQDGTESVDLPPNTFTNGTYLFDGWNTEADGSGVAVADGQAGYTPGKKDVTLYAQWKERTYTIKYDTAGGTPATIADKENVKFSDAGLLPADTLSKEGCTLTGWKVQGTDTKVENITKYSELVADYLVTEVTLEAQWSENTYTVKYDTNGGNPAAITDKTNVKFKDTGLLPPDNPTRTGYSFAGWEVDGKQVKDATTYKELVADDTVNSVTLKAQWKEKEYTVKYDTNGGTPTAISPKEHVKFWDADLIPADTMTKPGYLFSGWTYNMAPVSDNNKYSDLVLDDTVTSITLVAQWTPKSYKVNYDVNGGKPDNYPSETVRFESVVPLPAEEPTKDGYDFKGWVKDTTKIDGMNQTYDSLVADDTISEITLTARWEEKSYTVKFALKDGERGGTLTGDTNDQSVKYNQHAAAGADVTTNIGSAFLGWSYHYIPAGSTTPVSGTVMDYTTVPILNDVTFTANFAKVPFVSGIATNGYVSVQKGGAPADAGTDTVTKIEYDLTDTLPAEAGFKFNGILHYHIDEIKFNDLYKNEFILDLNSKDEQAFTVGEAGHTSTVSITVDQANKTVSLKGVEESLQFSFLFTEDTKYTVSFKAEKDSADNWGENTGLYTGDAMGNAPDTNPVKPGYTFHGWSSDGSSDPDKMYDPAAVMADQDEVYYAVWIPKEYTVHYNTDGGTTVQDKTGIHYTDTGLTPADAPTKPGYMFAGWEKDTMQVDADTVYNTLVADDTIMEVTLTAKWNIKHFTASWVTKEGETLGSIDGGKQTEEGISYNGNAAKDVTATPASNDSEFIGWEYSYIPDGSTESVTGFTDDYKTIQVLGDILFTAKFAAKPFVSIGATNGKVTAVKGTIPEEISEGSGTTALVQYTAADDIVNNKGTASLKYAADMHYHLTAISFKDMVGHEYTIWTKDGGGQTAAQDYEVGPNTPPTKVKVENDEKTGVIQVSNIDTSLAFTVVFEEDSKYKVEFFREKDDPASLVQTNDGLYTGNPVGDKPEQDPAKPGYHFLGWSTDGTNDPAKMYSQDTRIADADIAYYGVWELIDYKLTISNTVEGEHGNKKQEFHFTVALKDKDGIPLSGTYSYTGDAIAGVDKPADGTITLDANGKAEITLKHGQSILLDGLHIGEQYSIEETEANQNGYVTAATGENNLDITGDSSAAFTNTRTTTPPTGIDTMNHVPAVICLGALLILLCAGFIWMRRKRRA